MILFRHPTPFHHPPKENLNIQGLQRCMGEGFIVKNNQSREEKNLCWVWSKDEVPFPSENQMNNVIPEPAVQSPVTSAAQLVTCSSTDGFRTLCVGAASPLPVICPVTILHEHPIPSSPVSLYLDVQGSVLP